MVELGQLEAIKSIHSLAGANSLLVGNMNTNTECMEAIMRSLLPHGENPKNLLFGVDMGFSTALALGLARALPHRKVIAIDGDGSVLMKLATFSDAAKANPPNLIIVVMDNESYGGRSVEATVTASVTNLAAVARASGVKNAVTVKTPSELKTEFSLAMKRKELSVIVAKVKIKPEELKQMFDQRHWVDVEWESAFIRHIENTEKIRIIPETWLHGYMKE